MNRYECETCGTEFTVEGSAERCLKCGSLDISLVSGEIASPAASQEATGGKEDLPAVREVLRRLCRETYESTFQGQEWNRLIDAALIELLPMLKGEKVPA